MEYMSNQTQKGSAMLEAVIFLALASFLFMMVVGQLVFMVRVSRQEDARVQGLMAARVKIEELRSGWPEGAFTGPGVYPREEGFSLAGFLPELNMLGDGKFWIDKEAEGLYEVVVSIYDKKGAEVYSTQTMVWLKP